VDALFALPRFSPCRFPCPLRGRRERGGQTCGQADVGRAVRVARVLVSTDWACGPAHVRDLSAGERRGKELKVNRKAGPGGARSSPRSPPPAPTSYPSRPTCLSSFRRGEKRNQDRAGFRIQTSSLPRQGLRALRAGSRLLMKQRQITVHTFSGHPSSGYGGPFPPS